MTRPRFPGRTAAALNTGRRTTGLLRAAQVFGLSLAGLTLGGLTVLSSGGQATQVGADLPPQFTVLLAGRDIVYCYYHQPCKDQNQRTGLLQPPNTDTLMLVKVSGAKVTVLNIPRDTNVGEYDPEKPKADQKVNSQYFLGGPQALLRAELPKVRACHDQMSELKHSLK